MVVQEMHIDFDVKIQKIDSNAIDTFLPQEIDWLLNLGQLKLLRKHGARGLNRRKEGGEDSFNRYEDFNHLIKRVLLPAVINTDDDYVSAVLPYDFFDYRNGKVKSFYNCHGITKTVLNNINYHSYVEFADSATSPNKFTNFNLAIVRNLSGVPVYTDLFTAANFNLNFGLSFTSNEEKFIIINHVLEVVNRNGLIEVRWERYGDIYKPNSFIFITNDSSIDAIRIQYDAVDTNVLVVNNLYDSYADVNTAIIKNRASLRLVETEELNDALDHPYAKTIYDSPITALRGGQIQVYHDEKFIANTISIDYIRKPRLISLSLNQSCEIAESRHDVIVDFAVQLASAYIGSEVHKYILNENLINE